MVMLPSQVFQGFFCSTTAYSCRLKNNSSPELVYICIHVFIIIKKLIQYYLINEQFIIPIKKFIHTRYYLHYFTIIEELGNRSIER